VHLSVSGTTLPFHHGNVVLPGFSQETSFILLGSLSVVRILLSIKVPNLSPISITRHGLYVREASPSPFTSFGLGKGESLLYQSQLFLAEDTCPHNQVNAASVMAM
jgi:hypothetical protein